MKVKVKVLVTQSYLTLCYPMDFSLPGSSVHGILQSQILEMVANSLLQGTFQIQRLSSDLLHCRQILYHLSQRYFSLFTCYRLNVDYIV